MVLLVACPSALPPQLGLCASAENASAAGCQRSRRYCLALSYSVSIYHDLTAMACVAMLQAGGAQEGSYCYHARAGKADEAMLAVGSAALSHLSPLITPCHSRLFSRASARSTPSRCKTTAPFGSTAARHMTKMISVIWARCGACPSLFPSPLADLALQLLKLLRKKGPQWPVDLVLQVFPPRTTEANTPVLYRDSVTGSQRRPVSVVVCLAQCSHGIVST